MKYVIYLSMVCASISFTVTEAQLFEPLRRWLKKKNPYLGKLFSCGYCLGHWVAFALVAAAAAAGETPRQQDLFPPGMWRILEYFFMSLIIAWLSGIQWILMCRLMEKAGK